MTQFALATRAGLSRATIAALERGRYRGAELDTLQRLADALSVQASELLHGGSEAVAGRLQAFRQSSWARAVRASEAELRWLGQLPAAFYDEVEALPQAMAELLAWYRRHRRY